MEVECDGNSLDTNELKGYFHPRKRAAQWHTGAPRAESLNTDPRPQLRISIQCVEPHAVNESKSIQHVLMSISTSRWVRNPPSGDGMMGEEKNSMLLRSTLGRALLPFRISPSNEHTGRVLQTESVAPHEMRPSGSCDTPRGLQDR